MNQATSTPTATDTQQTFAKQKPVDEVRIEGVRAAIWRNENGTGVYYGVTIDRSYKDGENAWHNTQSFRFSDLPTIAATHRRSRN